MPIATAQTSMSTLRAAMALSDRLLGTTSGAGNAGGTTAVASRYIGYQVDFFRGKHLLLTSGANNGEWREITDFTSSSGTFTVANAYSNQVANAVTFEVYTLRPDLFKLAANRAIPKAYHWVYRQETHYLLADVARKAYGVPRGMRHVWRVSQEAQGSEKIDDRFGRADSTTSAGSGWTATGGTWGISGERLYSVTDVDGNHLTRDPDLKDGHIRAILRGTLNSGTVYRSPALTFRIREDYLGAIDATNMLLIRLLNGNLDLRKVDAGTESSLTTAALTTSDGVDYLVDLIYEGNKILVTVDELLYIQYTLLGLNLKYLDFPRVGVRWDKGGSPATAARVDDYRAHSIVPYISHHDWEQSSDLRELRFGDLSRSSTLYADRWLRCEGGAPLTLFAADTTYGTLASDTTAVLEIETTDEAWLLFTEECRAELYDMASDPAWNGNIETLPRYAAMRDQAKINITELKRSHAMPRPQRGTMYAY